MVVVSVVFRGCKVARVQGQTKGIFLLVLLWFDYGIIDYFCTFAGLYRSGDGGGRAAVVWCGGGGGVVVVPVVVEVGRAIPPSSSV